VAIVLLILLIAASILGTLIPQGRSAQEYLARYGQLAGLFQKLQFTRLYQSFWYVGLLALFSLNIIICTLVRLSPKLRRVFRPTCDLDPRSVQVLKVKDKFKLALPRPPPKKPSRPNSAVVITGSGGRRPRTDAASSPGRDSSACSAPMSSMSAS